MTRTAIQCHGEATHRQVWTRKPDTWQGVRDISGWISIPVLTARDVDRKLEEAAHLALTVLGQIMRTDPEASTRVRAASVIMDAYTRSRAKRGT